jgi:hypothetical protein
VIHRRELHGGRVLGQIEREALDRGVEVEEQRPLPSSRTML